ncbi:MAG: hypothetical protein KAU28_00365 [Phycisphaerae bacterium]|nr:hypothetical protein [Phycisphaerae bacterium]
MTNGIFALRLRWQSGPIGKGQEIASEEEPITRRGALKSGGADSSAPPRKVQLSRQAGCFAAQRLKAVR